MELGMREVKDFRDAFLAVQLLCCALSLQLPCQAAPPSVRSLYSWPVWLFSSFLHIARAW